MNTVLRLLFLSAIIFLNSCTKQSSERPTVPVVVNKGVSGNTTASLLARTNDVFGQKPDLVIIMIGTNDAIAGGAVFHSFANNLSRLIDTFKTSGIAVMLLTPPPIAASSPRYFGSAFVDSACVTMKKLSLKNSCYFVDIHTQLLQAISQANAPALFVTDGIHPNKEGYLNIGQDVYDYLHTNAIAKKKIVCFGDSITYGAYVTGSGTAEGDTYPAVLQRDLLSQQAN